MPHYDYECESCKHQLLDVQQSIKDDALTKCPNCNNDTLSRIITGGLGFTYKSEPTTIGQLAERNYKSAHDNGQVPMSYTHKPNLHKKLERVKKRNARYQKIKNMDPKDRQKWIREGKV